MKREEEGEGEGEEEGERKTQRWHTGGLDRMRRLLGREERRDGWHRPLMDWGDWGLRQVISFIYSFMYWGNVLPQMNSLSPFYNQTDRQTNKQNKTN